VQDFDDLKYSIPYSPDTMSDGSLSIVMCSLLNRLVDCEFTCYGELDVAVSGCTVPGWDVVSVRPRYATNSREGAPGVVAFKSPLAGQRRLLLFDKVRYSKMSLMLAVEVKLAGSAKVGTGEVDVGCYFTGKEVPHLVVKMKMARMGEVGEVTLSVTNTRLARGRPQEGARFMPELSTTPPDVLDLMREMVSTLQVGHETCLGPN
jgi:hypothetical protein